jgi:hypothetical protein
MSNQNESVRKAFVQQEDGSFLETAPIDLKEGMIFKLTESDGTEVRGLYSDLFLAKSDAFINENGVTEMAVGMLDELGNEPDEENIEDDFEDYDVNEEFCEDFCVDFDDLEDLAEDLYDDLDD